MILRDYKNILIYGKRYFIIDNFKRHVFLRKFLSDNIIGIQDDYKPRIKVSNKFEEKLYEELKLRHSKDLIQILNEMLDVVEKEQTLKQLKV